MYSNAMFSPCRIWRYSLTRIWDESKPVLVVIGLNPSTADEKKNDPTVTREIGFAQLWGYGGLLKVNAFAYRATDPKELLQLLKCDLLERAIGPENDRVLREACAGRAVLAAWGTIATVRNRSDQVEKILEEAGARVRCLGRNKDGTPKHPLYLAKDTNPEPYEPRKAPPKPKTNAEVLWEQTKDLFPERPAKQPTEQRPRPDVWEVGDLAWTKFNDGGNNAAWHPWAQVRVEWVSGLWADGRAGHVVEVVTLKKVGKSQIRLTRSSRSLELDPPPGERCWGSKDKKTNEKRVAAIHVKETAGALFRGCRGCSDEDDEARAADEGGMDPD